MSILENASLKDTLVNILHIKNTQDNFIFKDDNDNIIGGINCNIYPGTRSYEIVKELPHEYIGQMDFIVFLLMYIYYNPAWKGFMVLNNED